MAELVEQRKILLIKAILAVLLLGPIASSAAAQSLLCQAPSASAAGGAPQTEVAQHKGYTKVKIAGLDVAIWQPANQAKAPLVVFSHGFHGTNTQSIFLMKSLALAGYMVVAPNHRDAGYLKSRFCRIQLNINKPDQWSDKIYSDRTDDIVKMLDALAKDDRWKDKIDWSRVALCGHSLGGYTVLGMGGAWPSWKLPAAKAVLALSPYCTPFIAHGTLAGIGVPVMYQGGTRDRPLTPTIMGPHGAFSQTSSPAYFVEFDRAGHLAWTNRNHHKAQRDLISSYCVAFLDEYVKGDDEARPAKQLAGTAEVLAK